MVVVVVVVVVIVVIVVAVGRQRGRSSTSRQVVRLVVPFRITLSTLTGVVQVVFMLKPTLSTIMRVALIPLVAFVDVVAVGVVVVVVVVVVFWRRQRFPYEVRDPLLNKAAGKTLSYKRAARIAHYKRADRDSPDHTNQYLSKTLARYFQPQRKERIVALRKNGVSSAELQNSIRTYGGVSTGTGGPAMPGPKERSEKR